MPPGLFRAEAVQRYLRAREMGDVLRLPPRWTRWAYAGVVAGMLLATAWLAFGRVERRAHTPAVLRLDPERVALIALVPAEAASGLRPGAWLSARIAGTGDDALSVAIESFAAAPIDACAAAELLEPFQSDAASLAGPVVPMRAHAPFAALAPRTLDRLRTGPLSATIAIELPPERPLRTLFPGLRPQPGR